MIRLPENFDETCSCELSDASRDAIEKGKLKIQIRHHGSKGIIRKFSLNCSAKSGVFNIFVANDLSTIDIGEEVMGSYSFMMWRESRIVIGRETTCVGARFICDKSSIEIGRDCMLSDQIIIQAADQHGIVDLKAGKIENNISRSVKIGDHVWIGRAANILYGADISDGSIVGFGSLVNKSVPKNSLAVGIPARVTKSDVTWCRLPGNLDAYSMREVERYSALTAEE